MWMVSQDQDDLLAELEVSPEHPSAAQLFSPTKIMFCSLF